MSEQLDRMERRLIRLEQRIGRLLLWQQSQRASCGYCGMRHSPRLHEEPLGEVERAQVQHEINARRWGKSYAMNTVAKWAGLTQPSGALRTFLKELAAQKLLTIGAGDRVFIFRDEVPGLKGMSRRRRRAR